MCLVFAVGVTGAKLDFFDHEAKEIIDLYEALLRKAAEHQILLVFHGSNKPTGRERTWPNELVRESVRGMESSGMLERARHQTNPRRRRRSRWRCVLAADLWGGFLRSLVSDQRWPRVGQVSFAVTSEPRARRMHDPVNFVVRGKRRP